MTNFGSIDQQFFTQTQDQEQWAEPYQSWSRVVVYSLKGSIFSGVQLYILSLIVPADDMGVVGHTQKTQTPMSSAKWKKQKNA